MTTKAEKADQAKALEDLRKLLKPGDRVYTKLEHVSSSGMSRSISAYIVSDGEILDITSHIARAGIAKRHRTKSGVVMGGAGMDMGFALVYNLSYSIFGDSPDNAYSLKQTWL